MCQLPPPILFISRESLSSGGAFKFKFTHEPMTSPAILEEE